MEAKIQISGSALTESAGKDVSNLCIGFAPGGNSELLGLFHWRFGHFYLRLVFFFQTFHQIVAYGNWLGLLYLWLKFGLVCLLTVGNRSRLFLVKVPSVHKLDLVFALAVLPPLDKRRLVNRRSQL